MQGAACKQSRDSVFQKPLLPFIFLTDLWPLRKEQHLIVHLTLIRDMKTKQPLRVRLLEADWPLPSDDCWPFMGPCLVLCVCYLNVAFSSTLALLALSLSIVQAVTCCVYLFHHISLIITTTLPCSFICGPSPSGIPLLQILFQS